MKDSPSPPSDEIPSVQPKLRPRNWSLWLGIGFFGAVSIALIAALASFLGSDPIAESIAQEAANLPSETTPPAATEPPADLREHQKLVSEVISDLDRNFLIGDSPTRGNPEANVVLFEFSDFQCPYCARATKEVDAFLEENASEVLYVYKNLPLVNIHSEAIPAALAAWAAGQQEQFWPFHDALFANQEKLGETLYVQLAEELALDLEQFNRDRASEAAQAAIARDLALAAELQLGGTPTFIMNDLLIPGAVPATFFAEALVRLQSFQEQNAGES